MLLRLSPFTGLGCLRPPGVQREQQGREGCGPASRRFSAQRRVTDSWKQTRGAVILSFQTTLLAPCQNALRVQVPLYSRAMPSVRAGPLSTDTCTRLASALLGSLAKIQEAHHAVKISSMFAREKPQLEFQGAQLPGTSTGRQAQSPPARSGAEPPGSPAMPPLRCASSAQDSPPAPRAAVPKTPP